ncbi:unnamed protein product, partial [Pylaiella littoralis]
MQSVVATERRALLMKEILDEAAFRNSVTDEVEQQRYVAESSGDVRALKTLQERESRLKRRRDRKNLFIQAVSDATDFKQERLRLDEAALRKARQREFRKKHGVGFLLPSLSTSKPSLSFGSSSRLTAPSARSSELAPTADCAASSGGADGCATSSSGGYTFDERGPQNGDEVGSNGSSAATTIADSSETGNLVAQHEHHLLQRRRHHHNFKKSAGYRNLVGTDGMTESDLSSLLLSRSEE